MRRPVCCWPVTASTGWPGGWMWCAPSWRGVVCRRRELGCLDLITGRLIGSCAHLAHLRNAERAARRMSGPCLDRRRASELAALIADAERDAAWVDPVERCRAVAEDWEPLTIP